MTWHVDDLETIDHVLERGAAGVMMGARVFGEPALLEREDALRRQIEAVAHQRGYRVTFSEVSVLAPGRLRDRPIKVIVDKSVNPKPARPEDVATTVKPELKSAHQHDGEL